MTGLLVLSGVSDRHGVTAPVQEHGYDIGETRVRLGWPCSRAMAS
jgi:hypothetical protein